LPIYAMPIYFRWLYFLSPFSYAFGAVVVNEFLDTDNQFTIAVSGIVIRSSWPNLLILFGIGVAWRVLGLVGIIRLFRRKRPGSLSWHLNQQEAKPGDRNRVQDLVVVTKSPRSPAPTSPVSTMSPSSAKTLKSAASKDTLRSTASPTPQKIAV
jgi:hypothetical protein